MSALTQLEARELVHACRYAPGYTPAGKTIAEVVSTLLEEGGSLALELGADDDVAVVRHGERLIAIGGDEDGRYPWVVSIEAAKAAK